MLENWARHILWSMVVIALSVCIFKFATWQRIPTDQDRRNLVAGMLAAELVVNLIIYAKNRK